jgi:hypothetical protein
VEGIADHLRRGVTTVQRWEREEGLPVHRHAHAAAGTVFENGIYFAGRHEGRPALFFFDFASHRKVLVGLVPSGRIYGRIDVSPDGLWLLAAIGGEGDADLRLVEGFR